MNSLLSTTDLIIFFEFKHGNNNNGLWPFGWKKRGQLQGLLPCRKRYPLVGSCRFNLWLKCLCLIHSGHDGVGYIVGFAESQFEITAIAGLLLLCCSFLPVYRKMNVFTLSEYLGKRYDDRSRISFACIMVVIMVVVQMVPGF